MNKTEGTLIIIASIAAILAMTGAMKGQIYTDGSQRPDARGMGDDQYNEGGVGFDLSLQAGIQPDEQTRWHYGGGMPGEAIPSNWERHRLSYPRRNMQNLEELTVTPMGHPDFPKRESVWYYCPPAEVNF